MVPKVTKSERLYFSITYTESVEKRKVVVCKHLHTRHKGLRFWELLSTKKRLTLNAGQRALFKVFNIFWPLT